MRRNRGYLKTSAVILLAALSRPAVSELPDELPPLEVVGEEAYRAMTRFYDYDPGLPLEAQVLERVETESSVRYKIIFRGVRGFLVPSYLELPSDGEGPHPCVFLLHGWSGSKSSWWEDDGYIT